mgnify:CR=1 FL=1
MLAARGLDRISIDEIARKAGISRGLLFHYFPSKSEFALEIVRHSSNELLECTRPQPGLPPLEMLRDSMRRYLEYVVDNRDGYIALIRGMSTADADMRAVIEDNRSQLSARITEHLPTVDIDPAVLDLAIRGWIAFVEEITISWLQRPTVTEEQLLDLYVDALAGVSIVSVTKGAAGA